MVELRDVIPEKKIILLSPHYDDVPLTWGGYLGELAQTGLIAEKNLHVVHYFSRSTYQVRDDVGNADTSRPRIQYATGIRLIEDLTCIDALVGHGNYRYEIWAERECVLRQKGWQPGEKFEFPHGNSSTFDEEDWEIFKRTKANAPIYLSMPDTAILIPLSVKEHVDHVILRDAFIEAARQLSKACKAALYFGEDQPYTGLASESDWQRANKLIKELSLKPLDYFIDVKRKTNLIMESYPTQVEDSYREGVVQRSAQLAQFNNVSGGVERIYRWPA